MHRVVAMFCFLYCCFIISKRIYGTCPQHTQKLSTNVHIACDGPFSENIYGLFLDATSYMFNDTGTLIGNNIHCHI